MSTVGSQEVLIVLAAILIFFGPRYLPRLAAELKRWLRQRPARGEVLPRGRDRPGYRTWIAFLTGGHPAARPTETASRADAAPSRGLTAFAEWIWAAPVILSMAGLLIAVITDDHRLASRSAAILLVCVLIRSVQNVLDDRSR